MIDCRITHYPTIDNYICLSYDHPYITILILFIIGLIASVVWFAKTQMPREEEGKKGFISEFFSELSDIFKGMK